MGWIKVEARGTDFRNQGIGSLLKVDYGLHCLSSCYSHFAIFDALLDYKSACSAVRIY